MLFQVSPPSGFSRSSASTRTPMVYQSRPRSSQATSCSHGAQIRRHSLVPLWSVSVQRARASVHRTRRRGPSGTEGRRERAADGRRSATRLKGSVSVSCPSVPRSRDLSTTEQPVSDGVAPSLTTLRSSAYRRECSAQPVCPEWGAASSHERVFCPLRRKESSVVARPVDRAVHASQI